MKLSFVKVYKFISFYGRNKEEVRICNNDLLAQKKKIQLSLDQLKRNKCKMLPEKAQKVK